MLYINKSEIGEFFVCFYEKLYSHMVRLNDDYRVYGNGYEIIENVRKTCASL